jgi:mannitol/fructose-specific phosphotransferase system IIA component (Ntr-type)
MNLDKYLRPECVLIGMKAADKWEAIDELLGILDAQDLIEDMEVVRTDLHDRERKMSTGMEFGLALPHAKSNGAKSLAIALGVVKDGIDFDSLDHKPANVIFLVISRKDITGPHIQCLAEIARLYKDESLRERLSQVKTPQDALKLLA